MNDTKDGRLIRWIMNLMRDVYYPFSACIWLDEMGEAIGLYQFDTSFCKPNWDMPYGARACILVSNHPDGDMRPSQADVRNLHELKISYPLTACRMLIHSEDEGIREISAFE